MGREDFAIKRSSASSTDITEIQRQKVQVIGTVGKFAMPSGAPDSDIASREEWRSNQPGAFGELFASEPSGHGKGSPLRRQGTPGGKAPAAPVEPSEPSSEESSDEG